MANGTIDNLDIEISASSDSAIKKINDIASALGKLKGISTLSKLADNLMDFHAAVELISEMPGAVARIDRLVSALSRLKGISISNKLADNMRAFADAVSEISNDTISKIDQLTAALSRLQGVNLRGFSNAVRAARNATQTQGGALQTIRSDWNPRPETGLVAAQNATHSELIDKLERDLENGMFGRGSRTGVVAIEETSKRFDEFKTRANAAIKSVKTSLGSLHSRIGKVNLGIASFVRSIGRIAFYRAIRSAIKAVTDAFSEGSERAYFFAKKYGEATKYISNAMDSISSGNFKMSNQLGAAWVTLIATIEPILIRIINLVTKAADAVTQFFAILSGSGTYLKAKDYTKAWADDTEKGAKAAKEWRNQILGFDEINRLEAPSSGVSAGTSDLYKDYENMFEEAPVSQKLSNIVDIVKKHIDELMLFLYAAEFAIGLILVLTGANIPLGLFMMAHGAYKAYGELSENWGKISENVSSALQAVELVAGGFMFGLGLILTLTGANIPVGLALMAAGLTLGAAAALHWEDLPNNIRKTLTKITLIASGALLGLGVILTLATPAFSALGLALIVAGAAGLAASITTNWNTLPDKLASVLNGIVLLVSGASLAIGAVLTFTGANIPLGIALLALGAVGLVASKNLKWDAISSKIKNVIGIILSIVSGALAAVGVILCLSGAGIPLGLALIWAGMKTSHAAMSLSNAPIVQKVSSVVNTIHNIISNLFSWISRGITNIINGIGRAISWLQSLNSRANRNAVRIQNDGSIYLQGFASGGFVEDGLFTMSYGEIAGKFSNGKTAVANNEQITEGIAEAVYGAFVRAFAETGGSGNNGPHVAILQVNGREFARATYNDQQAVAKEKGMSLITNFA